MTIVSLILQCLLIFAFFFAGASKVTGAKMQVRAFEHLRLPQWFRVVTGLVTLAGVAGMIGGFWNEGILAIAALWIACIMVGAVFFHSRVKDPIKKMIAPLVLMVLALALAFIHISKVQDLIS